MPLSIVNNAREIIYNIISYTNSKFLICHLY